MWSPCLPTLVLLLCVFAAEGFLRAICRPNPTALDFEALSALFGPLLPTEGLTGFLVEARPADTCRPMEGPPNSSFVFVAFVLRYHCAFTTKVWHAQRAGFPGPCSSQMILLYTCWVICSLELALISSLLLEKCLSRGPSSRSRRRQLLLENGQSRASIVSSPSKYQECAICLEKYARSDSLKVLSCSHAFHRRCINLWHNTQMGSKTCPLCKQKVTVVSLLHATRFCRDRPREIGWTAIPLKSRPTAEGHRPHRRLHRHPPSQF